MMKKPSDPINQANVYLAYGRKAQAVQLLEAALKEDPAREDCRAKLAEIRSSRSAAKGLTVRQSVIVITLLIAAASLKLLDYQPWFTDAGSLIGFSALLYMGVCLARGRRA